jgi:hypothetical protein
MGVDVGVVTYRYVLGGKVRMLFWLRARVHYTSGRWETGQSVMGYVASIFLP